MPTPIKSSEIEFEGTATTIIDGEGGEALRNALVQKQVLMMAELVQNGTIVRPSEITIDGNGRVIIKNEDWTNVLRERASNAEQHGVAGDEVMFNANCICFD